MDEADPWYSEKKLFSFESSALKASLQSFCRQKRLLLPFVSQKSIPSSAGKRSVRSSKRSDGLPLGLVLEWEECSGQRRTLSSPCADPFCSACQNCLVARLSAQAPQLFLSTALTMFALRAMQNALA